MGLACDLKVLLGMYEDELVASLPPWAWHCQSQLPYPLGCLSHLTNLSISGSLPSGQYRNEESMVNDTVQGGALLRVESENLLHNLCASSKHPGEAETRISYRGSA